MKKFYWFYIVPLRPTYKHTHGLSKEVTAILELQIYMYQVAWFPQPLQTY